MDDPFLPIDLIALVATYLEEPQSILQCSRATAAIRQDAVFHARWLMVHMADAPISAACNRFVGRRSTVVRILLKELPAGAVNNKGPFDGSTPMHIACGRGRMSLFRVLRSAGADLSIVDCRMRTPLHTAAGNGQRRAVRALLKLGVALNPRDWRGNSPLHLAVQGAHVAVIKLLLQAGAGTIFFFCVFMGP